MEGIMLALKISATRFGCDLISFMEDLGGQTLVSHKPSLETLLCNRKSTRTPPSPRLEVLFGVCYSRLNQDQQISTFILPGASHQSTTCPLLNFQPRLLSSQRTVLSAWELSFRQLETEPNSAYKYCYCFHAWSQIR
jgi:hypothetical protein